MQSQCKARSRQKTSTPRKRRRPWCAVSEVEPCGDVCQEGPWDWMNESCTGLRTAVFTGSNTSGKGRKKDEHRFGTSVNQA
jgi:hypothetical protein